MRTMRSKRLIAAGLRLRVSGSSGAGWSICISAPHRRVLMNERLPRGGEWLAWADDVLIWARVLGLTP